MEYWFACWFSVGKAKGKNEVKNKVIANERDTGISSAPPRKSVVGRLGSIQRLLEPDVRIFDEKSTVNRYFLLDLLRFLACIGVVVWHYQHFFFVQPGVLPEDFESACQPFFTWLSPLYTNGYLGVRLFWSLSGFVFFALFERQIADGRLKAASFAMDRFSRLYPLHFMALLAVLVLTRLLKHATGNFGIYPYNDLYHFVTHLFFVPYILPHAGRSFNDPVWSVSVELLAYVVFFVCARFFRLNLFKTVCLAVVFTKLKPYPTWLPYGEVVDQCLYFFFLGGSAYLLARTCSAHVRYEVAYGLLLAGSLLAALATRMMSAWTFWLVLLFSFPAPVPPRLAAAFTGLGNLTYSMYMIHVPVQLGILLAVKLTNGTEMAALAENRTFFCLYLLGLLGLSAVVYRFFELPAKQFLRRRWKRRRERGRSMSGPERGLGP